MDAFCLNFVSSLFKELIDRGKSFVLDKFFQLVQFDVHEELNELKEKLSIAETVLDNFQRKTENNWQHWQHWQQLVEMVTEASYDTEDLLDDITLHSSKISEKIMSKTISRPRMAQKIQDLHDKVEKIIKKFELVNGTSQQTQQRSIGYHNDYVVDRNQRLHRERVFGREKDKEAIIDKLLEGEEKIISIVGMDGLGKTTLAKYVLDDERIRNKFSGIVWAEVKDRFDVWKMVDILERRLQGEHARGNVLIVLDDLWEVNQDDDWDSFRSRLPNPSGCKVLITTNNRKVAEKGTESFSHHLQMVKDKDCEALIMDKASEYISGQYHRMILDEIAQEMAKMCKGLPVVANILAGVLSSKLADESNEEWRTYRGKDISELGVLEEFFFPRYRLNYLCMESRLRKCLAYCALFPGDYDFKKDDLVQLWMAEGFLQHERKTNVEQVGNDYFKELLRRSVFHRSGDHDDQEMPSYNMHEFIHRFAESMASYTCCQLKKVESSSSVTSFNKARHLSLLCDSITPSLLQKIEECGGLRTLLLLNGQEIEIEIGKVPYTLFEGLGRLRALDLSCTDIKSLPDSLVRLTNLRYLDASETRIKWLPESASELHRLEVLKLRDCTIRKLPKDLKNLTNLIHLDVDMKGLRCMPRSIGNLSFLKTLSYFSVGKKEGYRITELQNLNFLCGEVCLANLENVKDGAEAKEAMIHNKASITRLELKWKSCSRDELIPIDILDSLRPHPYLEELQVNNYGGSSFPSWITSPSYKFVSIHMQNCQNVHVLPSLGELSFLERLHIEGLDLVEEVDYHFYGEESLSPFPSLKSLAIVNMRGLRRWSTSRRDSMPKLQDVIVEDCPYLDSIESLTHINTLKTLEISHCPALITLPWLPVSIRNLIIKESDMVKQNLQHGGLHRCTIEKISCIEIDGTVYSEGLEECVSTPEDI